MGNSSRKNAQSWPYTRHKDFEEKLRTSNASWFAERGFSINNRMPYLLEHWEDWPKNIILPEVAQFIQAEQKRRNEAGERFPLHKYIHHGLSSQAMLFNLIGPFVVSRNLIPFILAFTARGIDWPQQNVVPIFEVENPKIFNEDTGQPTSIDLEIKSYDNTRSLFIEAKLGEREFGGCSVFQGGDCDGHNPSKNFNYCYLHYIGRLYWILLEKYGFLSGLAGTSPICPLALYYQFFRELIFAFEWGGDFVLLYDERNPSFYPDGLSGDRGLMPFLTTFVPDELRKRIHSINIQQMVDIFRHHHELTWLTEFEKKYALESRELMVNNRKISYSGGAKMNRVKFIGTYITRGMVLKALDDFDKKYPNTNNYDNWLEKCNYKYELIEKGKRYPPKHILSEVRKITTDNFGGGNQTNQVFKAL